MKNKITLMILSSLVALPLFGERNSDSYTIGAEGLLPQTSFTGGGYVLEGTLAPFSGSSSESYTLIAGANPGSIPAGPPVIETDLEDMDLLEGDTLILTVSTTGVRPQAYVWTKDGVVIEGAESDTLEVAEVTNDDEGGYVVTVSNSFGEVNSLTATISVLAKPVILVDLENVDDVEGGTVTLAVEAEVEGTPAYQWFKDSVAIEGATDISLELADLNNDSEGAYKVEITNEAGSLESAEALLNVVLMPVITVDLENVDELEGATITLAVEAEVEGTPAYQWFKDTVAIDGATTTSLELASVTGDDEGNYTVAVSNEAGSVDSSGAMVSVLELPVFLSQPSDKDGALGGSVLFRITARVEGTATYAWYKDGTAISGATSKVLSLSSLDADDIGSYTLEISNEAGSVTSNPATLTIPQPPADQVPAALLDSYYVSKTGELTNYRSDWFGDFSVKADSDFGWVWTKPLGWTYFALLSTPEASYTYPLLVGGIFYISEGSYPDYVYSYDDASWVLLNPTNDAATGSIWGWVYKLNEWVEYSE